MKNFFICLSLIGLIIHGSLGLPNRQKRQKGSGSNDDDVDMEWSHDDDDDDLFDDDDDIFEDDDDDLESTTDLETWENFDELIGDFTKEDSTLTDDEWFPGLVSTLSSMEQHTQDVDRVYKLANYNENCKSACARDGKVCSMVNINEALNGAKIKKILKRLDDNTLFAKDYKNPTSKDHPLLYKSGGKIRAHGWGTRDDDSIYPQADCDYVNPVTGKNYRRLCECHFNTSDEESLWLREIRECRGAECFDLLDDGAEKVVRKEYRMMSNRERSKFHRAVNQLMNDVISTTSKYHLLVTSHSAEEAPGAHGGPAFLPWHREYLKQMEIALRQVDPDVFIPYWDSVLDSYLPEPKDSIIWSEDFLGNGEGKVTTGDFGEWAATVKLNGTSHQYLVRHVGNASMVLPNGTVVVPAGRVYKESDWEFAASRTEFNDFNACNDIKFFLAHGEPHTWVGGHMRVTSISPNEPSFFFHHCFIDKMWENFRHTKQTKSVRESQYPEDKKSCNQHNYANARMKPFTIKNKEGLSDIYTSELYSYADRASCSASNKSCGSKYLLCDNTGGTYHCVSKVRKGGNCKGFEGKKICQKGKCSSAGRCPS